MAAYTTINKSTDYFRTKLYAGNSTASRAITFDETGNMQPDWVWIKETDGAINHYGFDAVAGATKSLSQNTNSTESTRDSTWFNSFDTNGFTVGTEDNINDTGDNYAAWCWRAGTTSGLSGGTITPSSYSINTTSGFGIYRYTGTGSAGTIAHGLGKVPAMIMVKPTSATGDWYIYHKSLGNANSIRLNHTAVSYSSANWNSTTPTNSLFSLRAGGDVNTSGTTYVAYCFADVRGYSRFGSFTGTAVSGNGPYIYTGFKPAFVIYKNASAVYHWGMYDNKRSLFNVTDDLLFPNLSNAQSVGDNRKIDMLSNGFKIRATSDINDINGSGNTIIYWAFAENPLVDSTGNKPATAK